MGLTLTLLSNISLSLADPINNLPRDRAEQIIRLLEAAANQQFCTDVWAEEGGVVFKPEGEICTQLGAQVASSDFVSPKRTYRPAHGTVHEQAYVKWKKDNHSVLLFHGQNRYDMQPNGNNWLRPKDSKKMVLHPQGLPLPEVGSIEDEEGNPIYVDDRSGLLIWNYLFIEHHETIRLFNPNGEFLAEQGPVDFTNVETGGMDTGTMFLKPGMNTRIDNEVPPMELNLKQFQGLYKVSLSDIYRESEAGNDLPSKILFKVFGGDWEKCTTEDGACTQNLLGGHVYYFRTVYHEREVANYNATLTLEQINSDVGDGVLVIEVTQAKGLLKVKFFNKSPYDAFIELLTFKTGKDENMSCRIEGETVTVARGFSETWIDSINVAGETVVVMQCTVTGQPVLTKATAYMDGDLITSTITDNRQGINQPVHTMTGLE